MERGESREEEAWRLEAQGETEVPETGIVADGVEGTYVDLNGEGHHGREQVKNHRSQSGVPGEEGEEINSPKRQIIRVESEETQDYVRAAKSTDQEEADDPEKTVAAAKFAIGVVSLVARFHHAYAIPSVEFFPSGYCSPTVHL